jgi:hypothetical protein
MSPNSGLKIGPGLAAAQRHPPSNCTPALGGQGGPGWPGRGWPGQGGLPVAFQSPAARAAATDADSDGGAFVNRDLCRAAAWSGRTLHPLCSVRSP